MGKRSILYVHVIVWALILERITGNSFPPEILNGNVNERIPENTKFGVTVATVTASDRDAQFPDNEIRLRMFAVTTTLDFFAIETETGNIFLKKDLTTDTSDTYQMYVQAYDMGSPSKTSATNATVTIDVYRNLRDPFFSGGPFGANIPETSVIGTSVLQVNFGDSDTDAPFNTVTVSAIGDDKALTYFRLESHGQIVVNGDLKADSDTQYLMRILAQDGGSPPRTTTTVATITVQRNINSPVFERQSYNETILETRQLGLSFLQVKATDGDTRVPYNEVRYLISSDVGSALGAQYFIVDDVTGDISLRQSPMLDNAKTVDYTFTVNAVDRGGRSAKIPASVRVTVIRNTNAPVFTNLPSANQINHNTSIGTQIFPVSARDPDPGVFGQLTYSLAGDGESTSVFNINPTSGVITLQQSLFSQSSTLYTLRVRVQDGGSPRKEAMNTLTLTVQRNFETPRFVSNSYTFTIKENEPIGFSVGQIIATDADSAPPNNLVEYYFVGSTPSQRFLIDSRTGVVTIRKDLTTEETPSSYTFRVQARDSGSPQRLSQEIPLTIIVQRNDHDPLFDNLPFSVTIPANANQFSTVYTVNSTDADTVLDFQRREYDIIGDDAATSLFAVDPTAGRITISSLLTSDPAVQYRVRVRVRDFGTPRRSSTSLLLVNVTRNLNAPQFNPTQYFATILETQTLGSSIQQVPSSDLDTTAPNNVPTYTLSGNALALQYFQVNPSTGVVSLYKDPRDDTATSYTLTVTVADNGSPSLPGTNTATVTVQVNRNLQPPRFINAHYSSTITRLVTDNILLPGVTVSTADNDTVSPFRDVTVSVIGDDSAASLFELAGSSVRVRNAANLAADTANTYKLRLLAEDGGSPRKTATTTIDITVRRNMVPPQFNPTAYIATILENYPVGSEIVMVSATDSDPQPPNNQFKYSITGDTTAMTYFYINPDSGRISLKQSIKGTGVNQFRLQVTATDEGTPSLSGQAIVTVDVTIDDTLRFTQLQPYTASIDENDPVDRGIITVIATPQPNIKYSIVGFSDSPDYFKIDETTGVISVKTDLRSDLSKRTTYLIQVRAEKQFPIGLQSVENLVNVTVLRNINPPVFNSTQYQANINEKYGLGQSVVQVFATDLDTQDVLLYSIIDQAGETEPFYMAPSTGIITLKQLLTGIAKTRYAFTVQVRDQSKPEKFGQSSVVINVRRNSQAPIFERTPYGAAINYNQAPGPLYTTSARDPDLTGTLTYEVIGYFSAPGYFTVNSNGEVILLSSLASDTALSYTLGLAAYDSDYPNDKAYANVTITVNRNPNAPEFTNPSYSITVNESYPLAVSLLQVSGQDADQHVVEYILESSNPIDGTQFFYLNPSTGVLTVSRPLTETGTQTFTLQVRLRDNGIPVRSSATTAPVTIFITRNNNGPIFAGTFTTSINETTPTNTAVLTVAATDNDPNTSPYGQLRYRIIGDGDFTQFFDIDPTTGSISVRRPLTSQDVALYQGRIVAEDGGSPPRSATATAIINILRNLNAPVFNPKSYTATIDETRQVGVVIVTVTATDADQIRPNNVIIFDMSDTTPNLDNAGLDYFSIRTENNRGVISITLPLYTDNLNTAVYTFSVRARDNGSPSRFSVDAATVTINVYRNLFPPIFQGEPYTASLNFNSPSGSTVRQVNVTDADAQSPHNTVTYSIIGDGTAQTLFSINPATGLITTRQSLQNNNVERSSILVMARDGGTPSLTATSTVSVTIARNLNAPEWIISSYTVNITETQDLGTPIATLSTRDNDVEAPYNTRITTLTGDTNMMQFFSLSENGQLSVKKQLTSTIIRTFTGTVSLRDGGNPPLTPTGVETGTITVYVTKNDHTPYFINEPYSKDLEGNIQLGASVFQVTARDDDCLLFGSVRYKIIGDDLAPTYFQIDENSGMIFTKNALSDVNQNQFKVRVEAFDGGSPSKTNVSVVTLTVKSNYQRTIFNQQSYFAHIPETQSLGQRIIAVTANDSDALTPFRDITYSLVGDGTATVYFQFDSSTGVVCLRQSVLPDTASTYNLRILASDGGCPPRTDTATVIISVQRNLNAPAFDRRIYYGTVLEQDRIGRPFTKVTATDSDRKAPYNRIIYRITESETTAINYFYLHPETGHISLNQCTNGTDNRFIFNITATDGGSPPLSDHALVDVEVKGCPKCRTNINSPRFFAPVYFVNIKEGEYSKENLHLIQISATDDDDGYDGDILFDIQSVSNNGDDKFKLEQDHLNTNANIICSGTLNRGETYVIMVRASDQALQMDRRRSSSVPVEVRVVP